MHLSTESACTEGWLFPSIATTINQRYYYTWSIFVDGRGEMFTGSEGSRKSVAVPCDLCLGFLDSGRFKDAHSMKAMVLADLFLAFALVIVQVYAQFTATSDGCTSYQVFPSSGSIVPNSSEFSVLFIWSRNMCDIFLSLFLLSCIIS